MIFVHFLRCQRVKLDQLTHATLGRRQARTRDAAIMSAGAKWQFHFGGRREPDFGLRDSVLAVQAATTSLNAHRRHNHDLIEAATAADDRP